MAIVMIQILGAFFAVAGFALVLGIPGKFTVYTGATGAVGWMVYLFSEAVMDSVVLASFFSAVVIAVISQILARVFKAPVTLFIIAAMMTLVPGAGMYRIVYYALQGDSARMSFYVIQTLEIAGAIAVAIFLADSVFRLNSVKKN